MKKISAIVLCLLVVLSCSAPAFAAGSNVITITPNKTQVAPGDSVDFTVTIKATDACRTAGLILQYDAAVFDVVEGKCDNDDALVATFDKTRGFIILFAKATVLEGELCTFTLKVRDAAATNVYEVGLKASMKDKDDPIEVEIETASISVVRKGDTAPDTKPTEKPTEPPKATEKPTEPAKETEKPTEPAKETKPAETEEPTEPATEAAQVTEPAAVPTDASTEPQPTVTEPAESTAAETQSATEAPAEPTVTTPEETERFEFPMWAIPVYAIGFALIIIILILKRRRK